MNIEPRQLHNSDDGELPIDAENGQPSGDKDQVMDNSRIEEEEEERTVYILYQEQPTGPIKYLTPIISPSTSIFDLKTEIFQLWNIPTEYQQLTVGNEVLEDSKTVDSYLLSEGVDPNTFSITLVSTMPSDMQQNQNTINTDEDPSDGSYSSTRTTYGPSYITNHDVSRPTNNGDDEDDFDSWEKRPAVGFVGLKNQGATCYLNSLIQVLYLTPEFRKLIYHFPCPYDKLLPPATDKNSTITTDKPMSDVQTNPEQSEQKLEPKKDIIFQMQLLFARMQMSNVGSVSTSGLTTSFGWDNSDIFVQHDVQELNRVLCDKLEEKMKGKLRDDDMSIDKLYRGIMVNMIKCTNCGRISCREEDFYDVSLVIKGKKTIMESLDEFTEVETLKDDNAYFCEKCASKQTAEKSIKFRNLPTVLNIQLKRFEYDWENGVRVKLNDEIGFPNVLDARPYLVNLPQLPTDSAQSKDANHEPAIYELYGILVHSGNAGFGHYYAFIRNYTDGKWLKFNDEHVSVVDEDDIKAHNWLSGERSSTGMYSWVHSSMQRSATPYMLVYRRQIRKPVSTPPTEVNGTDVNMVNAEESDTFKMPAVTDSEVPVPIAEKLIAEQKRRELKRIEFENEMNSCTILVHRNRVDLLPKQIKCDKTITFEQFKNLVMESIANESPDQKYYYRFRRVASRKNHTKRPMQLVKLSDYDKTLVDIGLDKRQHIYLEQDTDPNFGGDVEDFTDDQIYITVRYWNEELHRPCSIRDFIFPKSLTLGQFKEVLSGHYLDVPPEKMIVVEEETDRLINFLHDDSMALSKFGIVSGDILHVEPLSPDHAFDKTGKPTVSLTDRYYAERRNELVLEFEETQNSFKRRTTPKKSTDDPMGEEPVNLYPTREEWKDTKIAFKIASNKTHTFKQLKGILSLKTGVDMRKLRVYAKDTPGYGEGRLLKDLNGQIGSMLQRFSGSKVTTELAIEILDHPEDLRKGDKLINTRYHNLSNEFVGYLEIRINKADTLRNFKTKLREKTGVPEDLQIISEWYNDHFYKLFPNEKETIGGLKIRKNDVLRMDEIRDQTLNITENYPGQNSNLAFQLVQFIAWDVTPYGRKEMQTTFPVLLTISEQTTVFELRLEISRRTGVPFHNINIASASHFPILDGYITPIREHIKNALDTPTDDTPVDVNADPEQITDPDERARLLAAKENRDAKTFNFKNEKLATLKKLRLRALDVICWEDLRTKIEKQPEQPGARPVQQRNKKSRDSEVLKING